MDRYSALSSNFTEAPVLLIDRHASKHDIYACARQRLRAAANLLETLTCVSLHQTDTKDIPHIINAIYLLVQDGYDLLDTAQF